MYQEQNEFEIDGDFISTDDESEGEKQLKTGDSTQEAGGDNVMNITNLDNDDGNGNFCIIFLSLSICKIDR